MFAEVAKDILRVDLSLLSSRRAEPEDDPRLLAKSLAPKTPAAPASQMQEVSHSVICDLLNFLVHVDSEEVDEQSATITEEQVAAGTGSGRTQQVCTIWKGFFLLCCYWYKRPAFI